MEKLFQAHLAEIIPKPFSNIPNCMSSYYYTYSIELRLKNKILEGRYQKLVYWYMYMQRKYSYIMNKIIFYVIYSQA